jgi:O-antigen/teichoic acid export membrane protein
MIFLIPIILNTLIINLGPLIFLEYFNEELLGIYSVITGFIMLIKDIESNFHLLLIPNYVNLLSNDKYEQLNTSIKVFEKYMTILNGLIIIGGIIFAEFFITNFMGDIYYDKGRYLFYGTLLSLIIFPLLVPYLSLLITKEKLKFYSVIAFSNFIFSLISWIFFIPYFNIIGIELGSWIFLIPQILITRFYCVKNFGIEKLQNRDIKHLFFLFILIIFCFIITFSQIQFFFLIVIFIIITGVYIIFLFSTHILEKKDIYYLLEILNPKKMRSYIRNEINGQEKKNS